MVTLAAGSGAALVLLLPALLVGLVLSPLITAPPPPPLVIMTARQEQADQLEIVGKVGDSGGEFAAIITDLQKGGRLAKVQITRKDPTDGTTMVVAEYRDDVGGHATTQAGRTWLKRVLDWLRQNRQALGW